MTWLSILVPIYNVADFLDDCLMSIMPQLDDGCEVILVDDASTDNSLTIAQDWAERFPTKITLLQHEKNQGLSAARNTMLEVAKGDYIWFLDSDDRLSPHSVAKLKQVTQQHNPDLVICDFEMLRSKRQLKHKLRGEHHKNVFNGSQRQLATDKEALINGLFAAGQMHIWSKIAKRQLWDTGLRFPVGRYFEDIYVTPKLALLATNYYYQPEVWVEYRQRKGSIMSTKTTLVQMKKNKDLSEAMLGFNDELQKHGVTLSDKARFHIGYFCAKNFIGACKTTPKAEQSNSETLMHYLQSWQASSPIPARSLISKCNEKGWFVRAAKIRYWLKKAEKQLVHSKPR